MAATPQRFDFRFPASLAWPCEHWYEPETFEEIAAQEAIRSARAQGLPDRITDDHTAGKLATLFRRARNG